MNYPAPLKVLYAIFPGMDTMDFTGPLEIFHSASHTPLSAPKVPVFTHIVAALTPTVLTSQNILISRHISISEAYSQLSTFDVLIIPGGGSQGVLGGDTEPIHIIKAFSELDRKSDGSVRTILSVCTGALFLAEAGVLVLSDGMEMKATTHPLFYRQLEEICNGKNKGEGEIEVVKDRFVVNRVRERNGLRVVTSGGVTCGMDACAWLIESLAGRRCIETVAMMNQCVFNEGLVL